MNDLTKLTKEEIDLLFQYGDGKTRTLCPASKRLHSIGCIDGDGSMKVEDKWVKTYKITPAGRGRIKREQVLIDIATKSVEKRLAEREYIRGKESQQDRDRRIKTTETKKATDEKRRLAFIAKHGVEPAKQLSLI